MCAPSPANRLFCCLECFSNRFFSQLELAKHQLIQERQQFHAEQVKSAEARARMQAQQQFQQQHGPLPMAATPPMIAATPTAPYHGAVLQQAAITPQMMQQQQQQIQPQVRSCAHSNTTHLIHVVVYEGPSLIIHTQPLPKRKRKMYSSA